MKRMRKILLFALCIIVMHSCKKEEGDPRDSAAVGVLVKKVVVTEFPQKDGNLNWDYNDNSGPDLFIMISAGSGSYNVKWESPVHTNAVNTVNHTFIPPSPVLLLNGLYISLYDYDPGSSSDDYIGYVPDYYNNDFFNTKPDSILLEDYYSNLSMVVYVDYVYEGL